MNTIRHHINTAAALRLVVAIVALGALVVLSARDAEAATVNVPVGNPNWFCDASYSMAECPTTVSVGDTVMWSFAGGGYHTTTECRGSTCDNVSPPNPTPLWDSGLLFGGTYSRVFNTPGVYYYMCNFHGYTLMRGKITVLAAVGGVSELPGAEGAPFASSDGSSGSAWGIGVAALSALLATAAFGTGAAWYARRRKLS